MGRRRTAIGIDLGWLVVLAVVGAVFDPAGVTARETMLPAAAERAGWPLERVNGLHEAIWGVAFIVGPGVGGVLIAWVGAIDAMWVMTVGFVLSAIFVSLLKVPHAGAPVVNDDAPLGVWERTRQGLGFRGALLLTATFILVLAVLPPFPVMIAASLLIGLAYGPIGPMVNLAMQARSPEHMRGRVVGIITSTEYAAGPLGYLFIGVAATRFGVRATFITVASVIAAIAVGAVFVRSLNQFDDLALPERGAFGAAAIIDEATGGALPLIQPPRDPDPAARRAAGGQAATVPDDPSP